MIDNVEEQPKRVAPQSPALQLFDHQSIFPKKLFYNPETLSKVQQLRKILVPTNLRKFERVMRKNGEPSGIIALLSGGPGTGKTELARQLALETGRDLLFFDVTKQRNMYFGETEKAIKQVFDDYHSIRKQSKQAPILFFNEGDAVFASRSDSKSNTSQTENSVQTILLQEMEVFDGVMVITTNRPDSFDAAFGRRILLNIEILDPVAEVRYELIRHIFPSVTEDAAKHLAASYSFTAAQLGVFRKQWELNSIVKVRKGTLLEELEVFLQPMAGKSRKRIGFAA
jgi:SpoVK/Ycf46/Vps4 family AAA+-type ATPase